MGILFGNSNGGTMTRSKQITRLAMIAALVFSGILIDSIITYGLTLPIKIAVATTVVVITISILCTLKEALFAGLVFGILSVIRALIMPSLVQAATINNFWLSFANPFVAIVPRVLIGLNAWLAFRTFKSMFGDKENKFISKTLPCSLTAFTGVATNTCFVALIMFFFKSISEPNFALWDFIRIYFAGNFLAELTVAMILVPFLANGLSRVSYFKRESDAIGEMSTKMKAVMLTSLAFIFCLIVLSTVIVITG